MPRRLVLTVSLPILLVVTLLMAGCGSDSSDVGEDASPDATGDPGTIGGDTAAFCTAVAGLARTDGTTDAEVVLPLIDEMRATAPGDISDDVNLRLDLLVEGNYAEHASGTISSDPSAVPLERQNTAAANVAAFVDEHCDLGS